jgi:hypothetical protein
MQCAAVITWFGVMSVPLHTSAIPEMLTFNEMMRS